MLNSEYQLLDSLLKQLAHLDNISGQAAYDGAHDQERNSPPVQKSSFWWTCILNERLLITRSLIHFDVNLIRARDMAEMFRLADVSVPYDPPRRDLEVLKCSALNLNAALLLKLLQAFSSKR